MCKETRICIICKKEYERFENGSGDRYGYGNGYRSGDGDGYKDESGFGDGLDVNCCSSECLVKQEIINFPT